MIVKCEQCLTRFRLDDAKVRAEGVRVRCSKCKHIFLVAKEQSDQSEEPDFDALLSGLVASSKPQESPATSEFPTEGNPEFSESPSNPFNSPIEFDSNDSYSEITKHDAESLNSQNKTLTSTQAEEDWFAGNEISCELESDYSSELSSVNSDALSSVEAFEVRNSTAGESLSKGSATESEHDEFLFTEVDTASEENTVAPSDVIAVTESAKDVSWDINPDVKDVPSANEGIAWDIGIPVEPVKQGPETVAAESGLLPSIQHDSIESKDVPVEDIPTETISDGRESKQQDNATTSFVEDDLPPLPIPSRRKGASFFPLAVAAIAVFIIVALAGVGFYMLNEGPAAFSKLGLESVAKWAGLESGEEGNMTIRNSTSEFVKSKEVGEMFVIKGEVVNGYRKPRASIQVKATLYGPKGAVIASRTVYCGNILTKEQLMTLPLAKIESALNNQFGDSLSNLGIPPGKSIPFAVVISDVPGDAVEFGLEVVGSTVASQ